MCGVQKDGSDEPICKAKMETQRVGNKLLGPTGVQGSRMNWEIWIGIYTLLGEGHGSPLQYSCLENPMARGAWWATVHRVAKSRTRLRD